MEKPEIFEIIKDNEELDLYYIALKDCLKISNVTHNNIKQLNPY